MSEHDCKKHEKYIEAVKWRDWQTCELICHEHKELVNQIDLLNVKNKSLHDIIENQQAEIKALQDAKKDSFEIEDDDFNPDDWALYEESRRLSNNEREL